MKAWTSVLAASTYSARATSRICQSWKQAARQMVVTWADIVRWLSMMTPRLRTVSTTLTTVSRTGTSQMGTLSTWYLDPNQGLVFWLSWEAADSCTCSAGGH